MENVRDWCISRHLWGIILLITAKVMMTLLLSYLSEKPKEKPETKASASIETEEDVLILGFIWLYLFVFDGFYKDKRLLPPQSGYARDHVLLGLE